MPLDVEEMLSRAQNMPINYFNSDSSRMHLGVDIGLSSENQGTLFITPSFRRNLNQNITYKYKLFITNNPDYGPRIGSRYERSGEYTGSKKPGDVSILQSYIQMNLTYSMVKLGKFSPWLGLPLRFNLEQNHHLPPVYGMEYTYEIDNIKYSHGHYWLGYSSAGDFAEGYSRFYATQKLILSWKYLDLGFGNKVIYAGLNQAMNWKYWIPFEPFLLSVFNFGAPSNNDNNALNYSFKFKPNAYLQFTGTLVIDEFEVDKADRKTNDDDFGFQLGSNFNMDNSYLKQVAVNYLYSSDYLGIHYSKSTNFEVLGLPIFSTFGPQTKRADIVAKLISSNRKLNSWISIYWQSQGANRILGTPWKPKATSIDDESWSTVIGIEAEMLILLYSRYYAFVYLNFDDSNSFVCNLSVAYTFNLSTKN